MNFTIKVKMIVIAAVSVATLATFVAITLISGHEIETATDESQTRSDAIELINTMRVANLTLILTAMDSIVDKDEGKIDPERVQVIAESIDTLTKTEARLEALANSPEKLAYAEKIKSQIPSLAKGIQVDLKEAIETNAGQEAFTKLDDVIDEFGNGMDKILLAYEALERQDADASLLAVREAIELSKLEAEIAAAISLVVMLGILFVVGRGIVASVTGMTHAMSSLASGDLDIEVPARDQKDEIGEMAAAVQVFKDNAIETKRLNAEAEKARQESAAMAEKQHEEERKRQEEKVREQEEKQKAMLALADSLQESVGGIVETLAASAGEMRTSAQTLSAVAEQSTGKTSAVASASEQATNNVQTVASAAEELSSSINEISQQVVQATNISQRAVTEVGQTSSNIGDLAKAADEIGEIIALITDIAERTNLLALNATIEAARAGDAGKGFAVVASEVGNLAGQTSKATDQIAAKISAIQNSTKLTVSAVDAVGNIIGEIETISSGISAAVEEQSAATQEISQNIAMAAEGTSNVSASIAGVSEAAASTGREAATMLQSAEGLSAQAENLRQAVGDFVAQIRSA